MTKQAKKAVEAAERKQNQLDNQQRDLQMRFSKMSQDQRVAVGQYLNAYNLAAWIYNELLDEDSRIYVDLAMKYTLETQRLAEQMRKLSDDSNDVQKLVDDLNNGE